MERIIYIEIIIISGGNFLFLFCCIFGDHFKHFCLLIVPYLIFILIFFYNYLIKKSAAFILFSRSVRLIVSVKYFSIIKLAIGPPYEAPHPAFSTKTAIAILGLSTGPKAIKTL